MTQTYIFTATAFVAGFLIAWILRSIKIATLNKLQKSTNGYLESERLMKETMQKENVHVHQQKQSVVLEFEKKLKHLQQLNKVFDENILLLQKSNEETEALLGAGEPEIYALKLKLLEAQNMIARYKSMLEVNV